MAPILWGVEGILEALGAYFFFRRRILTLWPWLAFRALADALGPFLNDRAYFLLDYVQRNAQYLFFAAAVVYVAGRILRENRKTQRAYQLMLCALMVLAVLAVHSKWPLSSKAILSLETWAELMLAAFVCLSLAMAGGWAPKPWGVVGSALILMGGADGMLTLLRMSGRHVEALYPIGDIVGLALLAWVGFRPWRLAEVRVPHSAKKPPTSVWVPRKVQARKF